MNASVESACIEDAVNELTQHGVVDAHHHMHGRAQRSEINPGLLDWLGETYLFCIGLPAMGGVAKELFRLLTQRRK